MSGRSGARRRLVATILVLACAAAGLGGVSAPAARAAGAPVLELTVSGPGIELYPAYDASIRRFALRTSPASNGEVIVDAATSDPTGTVRVNGRPTTGPMALRGVKPGDEISVLIDDSAGTHVHSLVYLPPAFPDLVGSGPKPSVAPGSLLLTLNSWDSNPDRFHAVVDDYGVPRWFRREPEASHDLRLQPNGRLSQAMATTIPGREGVQIVELDARFEPVARRQTSGLVNTDFHDALLRADGSQVLVSYEVDRVDVGRYATDSVFQELDPRGAEHLTWSTKDHVDRWAETVIDETDSNARWDYAHINSVTITPDGEYLVSFRGLSSIFKIARTTHDGYVKGEVIWRLGGRRSDFEFVADPYGGPCAQHTATQLPNGNVVVFDNGSMPAGAHPGFCVDPADPDGPTHARTTSRYVEWSLVEPSGANPGTATMVQQYAPGHFAPFTGSAFKLTNGNTLIGWGAAPTAIATELDPSGQRVWELTTSTGQGSYRVYRESVTDAFDPKADLTAPAEGASYPQGSVAKADYGCTDTGGSDLISCSGSTAAGGLLDTSTVGAHVYSVTAVDGEGNRVTTRHTYTVTGPTTTGTADATDPTGQPDLMIRKGRRWVGRGSTMPAQQRIRLDISPGTIVRAKVRLVNTEAADRFALKSSRRSRGYRLTWWHGRRNVTRAVEAGVFKTRQLSTGQGIRLQLRVRAKATRPPRRLKVSLVSSALGNANARDKVTAVLLRGGR